MTYARLLNRFVTVTQGPDRGQRGIIIGVADGLLYVRLTAPVGVGRKRAYRPEEVALDPKKT